MRKVPLRRRSPLRGGAPIKPKKRKPSEFARIYGSRARVEWIKSLPCVVGGGCSRLIENAHTENGGVGRKADHPSIIPLCHVHHRELHFWGRATFEFAFKLNLAECAARTHALWLESRPC